MMKNKPLILFSLLFLIFVFGCEKGVENSDTGTLSIKLTDAPFPIDLVSEANVKIVKLEVRNYQSESEGNPFLVLSEEDTVYNLLELQNGITADLVEIEVPVGEYDLVRLYVDSAGVELKDQTEFDMKVPSGSATGIKIFIDPPITVVGGLTTELVLDFDVSQSFVVQGNPYTPAGIKGFIFKPVVRAANVSVSGRIEGTVTDAQSDVVENAYVWIEDNGVTYTSFTDEEGYFVVANIPTGLYTVQVSKKFDAAEPVTVTVEDVNVVAGNKTQIQVRMLIEED
jgi:hypothetical protein